MLLSAPYKRVLYCIVANNVQITLQIQQTAARHCQTIYYNNDHW